MLIEARRKTEWKSGSAALQVWYKIKSEEK
jgi:hypothetical protein